MDEVKWLQSLKEKPSPDMSGIDVSRSVLRDILTSRAMQHSLMDQQNFPLTMRIWAAIAGAGALASLSIGLLAVDMWQNVFGASADLFTFWDVVIR